MSDTRRLTSDASGIAQAAAVLERGGLVALPTETVYGLGADARNSHAVAKVFAAKERPSFNPLIVHVVDISAAQQYVVWSDLADRLAGAFWPGPLTLVLPLLEGHGLSPLVTSELPSLAIRVPAHPVAQSLLSTFGGPIAAPSANPSGKISPTSPAHVMAGLSGKIDAVLEGGPCSVGLESTIIGLTDAPILLRPGGLPIEAVEAALGQELARHSASDPLVAPGQMLSHYAPGAPVRLNAAEKTDNEILLGFGPMSCDLNLSVTSDLTEAAAMLFEHLHSLDALKKPIAIAPIPETGLGRAINDRLRRAAAPRA